jgi:hypothetical protein
MRLSSFVAAALLALPATAAAQDVVPLTGTGENVAPIARVKVPGANELAVAGDWAFVSTDGVEETCGCLYIVNIKDPAHPFIQGVWDSQKAGLTKQSYGDVDISPDANLAVLTNAHGSGPTWDVIIDTSDKANPKMLSHVDDLDGSVEYVHTSTLDNKLLYLNPQVWSGYPQPGHAAITVVDISDPANPKQIGKIDTPGSDTGLAHDTYVDHRPDGKTLMYAASISKSDVIDITDPLKSNWLQSIVSKDTTISHDVQPNFDRSVILVDDEGAAGGQLDSHLSVCGKVGTGPASINSGSLHFYGAAADGTFANNGVTELGTFNAPANFNQAECVAHVFWQAPDQNRITQAYYNVGAWVIDFSDPADAKALGHFRGEGAKYWSNKAHNGYMYASDMNGHLDILRYTGEGGKAWPTTSGPAEIQLSARQGVPYVPIADASAPPSGTPTPTPGATQTFGRFKFTIKGKKLKGKRGKKKTLTLTFADSAGKRVGSARFKRKTGRKLKAKVTGVAATGTYKWVLKAGKRKLRSGSVKVGSVQSLASSATLVAKVK